MLHLNARYFVEVIFFMQTNPINLRVKVEIYNFSIFRKGGGDSLKIKWMKLRRNNRKRSIQNWKRN